VSHLTSDIPKLEAHNRLGIPVDHLEGKVHSDCGLVVHREDVVDVTLDDRGLTGANVAYRFTTRGKVRDRRRGTDMKKEPIWSVNDD
jgi:hypothetical protein